MLDFEKIVSDFCKAHQLQISFSSNMPEGYENANGSFDIAKNTLFFNSAMLASAPDFEALFYLYHELRHALQYTRPQLFSPIIQRSLSYVLMYDGTCFKLLNGAWVESRLEGAEPYLLNAYLAQPYELDANAYAYEQVKKHCGASQKLDELYSFWVPQKRLSDSEYSEIYNKIDNLTK